ncbi:4'-phosphopantetheinyl transferase family protein [Lewinella cohaerens]|uniref:4'-phosphopantetheinyl transferase family protein n=1 Tax=Lewinella cohaerens TaxID=70995 RepID=UPI00037627A1|nr:4'-phosphopantetheinyl transferase superfamily protein [Lewinella cohaerens]
MYSRQQQWNKAQPEFKIASHQVHIWKAALDATALQTEKLQALLSDDELARADKFHFEKDRTHYIAGRGMLRQILGFYLESAPNVLQFDYTPFGKPFLPSETGPDGLNFNLSHSGKIVLYAITRGQSVGVDIEKKKDNIDIDQIAQRFFSLAEISVLNSVPKDQKYHLFFQYWARKEALLKATGMGVSFPLEKVDVSQQSGQGWSPITLSSDLFKNPIWFNQDLFPGTGYHAAVTVEKNNAELSLSCF